MSIKHARAYLFINKAKPSKVLQADDQNVVFKLEDHQWHFSSEQAVVLRRYSPGKYIFQIGSSYLTDSGLLELKPNVATPPAKYLWSLSNEDHNGYRKISNVSTGNYLKYLSGNLVETAPITAGNIFSWKLILLPTLRELEAGADSEDDSSSDSDSDSDTDWEEIARYIFKEGLKMMKTAASHEWFDMDEETRNDYVRLWKKMGRKKGVYD
ncbi:hypothetical protein CNMCM5623_005327 [Aspergillus felis]|uniref:Uncharacterized protein n=1 Tax=Aspergillus felis TaxID=1287682 RepID=A0A8H6VA58_9EURO|nr:hypothetical protein CNMCM5623_005327 [Aspergillus felis]KAF7183237.1 hypothetical protein CNMCM7691_003150 [Aspergillus felis]